MSCNRRVIQDFFFCHFIRELQFFFFTIIDYSVVGYGHFRNTALVSKLVQIFCFKLLVRSRTLVLEYLNWTHTKHLSFETLTLHSCPVIRGNAKIAGLPTVKQTPYEEKEDNLHV